jgi:formylmethanofuran dehydrogenase subunit D
VRLRGGQGKVELPCRAAKAGELPPGVLFLPYGDLSSRLMGGDTHGTGMPDSKGIDVTLEKAT